MHCKFKQANFATIFVIFCNIGDFVKKTDFDDKLKNLNKKVTSNKSKRLLVKNEFKKTTRLNRKTASI